MQQPSTSSSSDNIDRLCSICQLSRAEKLQNVGCKGKATLKRVSIDRNDNLFSKLLDSDVIFVHPTCRNNFTNKINIAAAKRKIQSPSQVSPVKRKLRRSSSCSRAETQNSDDSFN